MSVNSIIIDALSNLDVPVSAETNNEATMPYIVFNISDDRGAAYANNGPQCDLVTVQIHLFTDIGYDYINLKKQVRSALFVAGFSYPQITQLNEDDYNHIVFECEIALEREE